MIKSLKYSILILWVLTGFAAKAQQAEAVLDTTDMLIGDQIPLQLRFTAPDATDLQWPYQQDTITKKIEIIDQGPVDTSRIEEGTIRLNQKLIITSFDTGYLAIPPFSFNYQLDGKTGQAKTDPLLLHVKPMAVDTAQPIKSIKGPMSAPLTFLDMLPWILLVLAILILVALIWYVIWRKRQQKPVLPVRRKPRDPADTEALKALEDLKQKKLWQTGKVKAYHSELSHILRVYLERRFEIPAIESTSADILRDMQKHGLSRKTQRSLHEVLELSDLVKFAKLEPSPGENEQVLQEGITFVEETRPVKEDGKSNELTRKGGAHVE